MIVALLIVGVIGAILCVIYLLVENSTVGYVPKLKTKPGRHRATHRAAGLSTAQRAKAAAERARVQTARAHAEFETWLGTIAPTGRVDELDFSPAADARFHVLAPRALDAQAHLDRKGLRLRHASPWGTPEDVDVWEPDLVGAR